VELVAMGTLSKLFEHLSLTEDTNAITWLQFECVKGYNHIFGMCIMKYVCDFL